MKTILLSLLCLLTIACGDTDAPEKQTETKTVAASPEEEALVLRLSYELPRDTSTQEGYDRQRIVNYAMDNLLDVKATRSGLFYQILDPGEGTNIEWGDKVRVHYTGMFINGKPFDSSYERDRPMEFYVGNTIQGWNEGLQLVAPGGKIRLLVPSSLAYGAKGLVTPEEEVLVPPNEILIFEVEVLERTESTEYE